MMRFLGSIVDRLFVITGALLGAQIPEFIQQYKQRLAGHVAELKRLLDGLHTLAKQSNKTLEEYVGKFLANSDPDFSNQGAFMQGIVERWKKLNEALDQLMNSTVWTRSYVFFRDLQFEIAKSTFYDFQPGLSMTLEGIAYMLIGAAIGFGCYQSLRILTQTAQRRKG